MAKAKVYSTVFGRPMTLHNGELWLTPYDGKGTEFDSEEAAQAAILSTIAAIDGTGVWAQPESYSLADPRARKKTTE